MHRRNMIPLMKTLKPVTHSSWSMSSVEFLLKYLKILSIITSSEMWKFSWRNCRNFFLSNFALKLWDFCIRSTINLLSSKVSPTTHHYLIMDIKQSVDLRLGKVCLLHQHLNLLLQNLLGLWSRIGWCDIRNWHFKFSWFLYQFQTGQAILLLIGTVQTDSIPRFNLSPMVCSRTNIK